MEIQYFFEIIGTVFFSISGALAADEISTKNWFGVTFVGFVTAIGGGSIRDILLGSYPLVWVNDVNFIYAIFIGILLMRLFYNQLEKLRNTLFLFDTLGIALFTIIGTEKAILLGLHPIIAAIMGMFTAVMGGVIRDTLTNSTPVIFRKEVYATACLVGAILFLILDEFSIGRTTNFLISGFLIFIFRTLAVYYKWSIPTFRK